MTVDKKVISLTEEVAGLIDNAGFAVAFTGAGISVESGIPSFRGEDGIWNRYDPKILEYDFFRYHPEQCWPVIKEIFYTHFTGATPNAAHRFLARLEELQKLRCVITQNIDGLHQKAGSREVYCFHGDSSALRCLRCDRVFEVTPALLSLPLPVCPECKGVLKPDFVFFGEGIPSQAYQASFEAASNCDLMLVIGTTGEVYPAAMLPDEARKNGARIIEINPQRSQFSSTTAHVHLPLKAGEAAKLIAGLLSITL